MFATPLTACAATRVKSGPPAATGAVALDGAAGRSAGAACGAAISRVAPWESAAVRIRPVTTRPATNPATMKVTGRRRRLSISGDVDPARAVVGGLRDRHREHAVLQIGRDALDVDRLGQREGARETPVAALDAMV